MFREGQPKERLDSQAGVEREKHLATIRLEFLRHDEKTSPTTAGPRPHDNQVRLTPEGRRRSSEAGKAKNPDLDVALVAGSPRERSVESALRQMLSHEPLVTPDMSLEDMRALVDENLRVGKKDMVMEQLNFNWDGSKEFHDEGYRRTLETHDALQWLLDDSDTVVRNNRDTTSTSYTRAAGNIAEVIQRYFKILPRWQEIVTKTPEKYQKFNNQLQRFLGSHQSVIECFLLKIIEKTEGRDAAVQFVESLPDQNGFDFSEGYSVILRAGGDQPDVVVRYGQREWITDPQTVEAVVSERNDLNKEIKQLRRRENR